MSPKRTDEISIKLRHEAKAIYDNLPAKGKGEWVSDAIIEKASNNADTLTLTAADKKYVQDRITEAVHACWRP
jgi:hypothetical protein